MLPERISSVTPPISFPPLKVKDLVHDTRLLSAFRLRDKNVLESLADELSAGQQQKLALSLALSKDPDLYIIDEPLANLTGRAETLQSISFSTDEGKEPDSGHARSRGVSQTSR